MRYRKLNKYKYQTVETFSIRVKICFTTFVDTGWIKVNGDKIIIKKGYAWDGATCAIDTKSFMVASLVHDALYQLIREKNVSVAHREKADDILKELCLKYGMPKWRANYVHWAVRTFGGKHIKIGKPQDKIYEV